MQLFFSFSPADDLLPIGSSARFGFVSMVRLNLALSLAKRGVVVSAPSRTPSAAPSAPPREAVTFGALLRRHRVSAGLTQEALAERARMSANGIAALERGTRRTPQRETLALLTRALALDTQERLIFEAAARREPRSDLGRPSGAELEQDLKSADVLIVVYTPAWMTDPTCAEHLTGFMGEERTPDPNIKRIIVVRRAAFTPEGPTHELFGLPTCDFFRSAAGARSTELLYRNDGSLDPAFYDVVDDLAAKVCEPEEARARPALEGSEYSQCAVYVSPAADDMLDTRRTLVTELRAAGYAVVPELTNALASIHLLGRQEAVGDADRSCLRTALADAAGRADADASFRRIIYAPKAMTSAAGETTRRDPIAVRDRLTRATAGDAVIGGSVTNFILSAKDLLRASMRRQQPAPAAKVHAGSIVFLNFHPGDVHYARALSKALRDRGVRARFAAFEDDKIQNKITNNVLAKESDAVIHCWANATDAWLYAEAAEYEDWRKFGRSQPFAARAAIAGPPESGSKSLYSPDEPPEAIDIYVDLTARALPQAADLDPIVSSFDIARPS